MRLPTKRPSGVYPVALGLVLSLGACSVFNPSPPTYNSIEYVRDRLDSSSYQARTMPPDVSVRDQILFYFPNRFLDIFDMFKVAVGAGPGAGAEVYLTENVWIGYLNYRSWKIGLDSRASGFYDEGHFKEWHLGDRRSDDAAAGRAPLWATGQLRPFEAPLQPGVPAVAVVPRNEWDIGAQLHFFIGVEVLVRPYQMFDFVVGLWGDDPAGDDFGVRYYPLHEYAPQGEIVEIFINAIDQMNDADLKSTLAVDLQKQSYLRRGDELIKLGGEAPPGFTGRRAVGDRGEDFLRIGNVELVPSRYRDPESGSLDFAVRCKGASLRWGVPAQFTYTLDFFNRFLQLHETYEITLQVEQEHWVITRLRETDRHDT